MLPPPIGAYPPATTWMAQKPEEYREKVPLHRSFFVQDEHSYAQEAIRNERKYGFR
jgi:hypothetical protein